MEIRKAKILTSKIIGLVLATPSAGVRVCPAPWSSRAGAEKRILPISKRGQDPAWRSRTQRSQINKRKGDYKSCFRTLPSHMTN